MTNKILEEIAMSLSNRSFVLKMETKPYTNTDTYRKGYVNHSYHVRENQPCYGELRKYESTHPGECTQPHNPKPGDLHAPFPVGTPIALALRFLSTPSKDNNVWLEYLFGSESPWRNGIGNVEFIRRDGNIAGMIMNDTKIDPTVLVNALKQVNSLGVKSDSFTRLLELGLNMDEAILLRLICDPEKGFQRVNTYSMPKLFSLKRYFGKNPLDLTGGTLFDRIDYNRTDMGNVFMATGKGTDFNDLLKEGFPAYDFNRRTPLDLKVVVPAWKKFLEKAIKLEDDPVDKKYVYTTTSQQKAA